MCLLDYLLPNRICLLNLWLSSSEQRRWAIAHLDCWYGDPRNHTDRTPKRCQVRGMASVQIADRIRFARQLCEALGSEIRNHCVVSLYFLFCYFLNTSNLSKSSTYTHIYIIRYIHANEILFGFLYHDLRLLRCSSCYDAIIYRIHGNIIESIIKLWQYTYYYCCLLCFGI